MLTGEEEKLLTCIRPDRVVATCAQLVRIPTTSPYSGDAAPSGELQGQLCVERLLTDMGAATERLECSDEALCQPGVTVPTGRISNDRPNIIGTLCLGDGDGPTLVLDAHIDTVSAERYDGDPFSGTIADGFLWGRGAADDKGGIAVMLEAMRVLSEAEVACRGQVLCCSVVDEECDGGGRGSLSCLAHLANVDAAVIIDGSTGGIWSGCSGVVTADVTVRGKAGHAATGGSVNAIEKAATLLPALEQFRQERGSVPGAVNLGVFHSGTHPANVPDMASLGLNIRTTLEDMAAACKRYGLRSGRTVREHFERSLLQVALADPFFCERPPEIRWVKDLPATICPDGGTHFLDLAAEAYKDASASDAPVRVEPLLGWGDICHFHNAGIPAVGIGPGLPGAAHSANEKVSVEDLVQTARALTLLVFRFLNGPV